MIPAKEFDDELWIRAADHHQAIKEALANVATSDILQERVDETAKQRHEPEPVAKVIDWGIEGPRLKGLTEDWPRVGTLLYACPPQRTWVGLTDEEIKDCMSMSIQKTCRAVEAKLKEKNT